MQFVFAPIVKSSQATSNARYTMGYRMVSVEEMT